MAEAKKVKKVAKKATEKAPVKKAAKKAADAKEPKVAKKTAVKKAEKAVPVPLFQAPTIPAKTESSKPDSTKSEKAKPAKKATKAKVEKPKVEKPEPKADVAVDGDSGDGEARRRRRRRGGRGRRKPGAAASTAVAESAERHEGEAVHRRRRRRRGGEGEFRDGDVVEEDGVPTVIKVREPRQQRDEELRGSTRLEAKKQRRREGRDPVRRRVPVITEAEFLARRESVDRKMLVRQTGDRTQIAVLEDGILVEHYVNRSSSSSYVGNVYLGRVQNVLPSMEAAFVDIGKGRNAVLYAGEVNWDAAGLADGEPKRIETALKTGQAVLVQVTKDPIGHKGARLTSQISMPGRFLVYVPGGGMSGISRKLPDTERNRLKQILKGLVPEEAGVIVRTAAEGASEEELTRDIARLKAQWEDIERKSKTASAPSMLYGEPDLTVRVIRDIFNEDFTEMTIQGADAWDEVHAYLSHVAPDLVGKLKKWSDNKDVFAEHRIDEQLAKALDRKVWLPSGGSLVIDRTEAMVVIDVNTGKFTGKGGNLEETVTKNNLEAAEEIARQLRLRDLGGIIVIDFIDMVLDSNKDAVLRRLMECLGRDRTKHQVAEVTSLGLVQMTRKRVGSGLLEAFSTTCESCHGRGVHVHLTPVENKERRKHDDHRHDDEPKAKKEFAPLHSEPAPAIDQPSEAELNDALEIELGSAADEHSSQADSEPGEAEHAEGGHLPLKRRKGGAKPRRRRR